MPSHPMVVEDGVQEETPRPRAGSGWILASVGFGLGIALGTIISSPVEQPSPSVEQRDQVPDAGPSEPEVGESEGISVAVPGFPDALAAVESDAGSGLTHLLWPVAGSPVARSMTGGSDVRFDARGQFLAMSEVIPGVEGLVVSMGRFNSLSPLVTGATSYAWHDSSAGRLAYTAHQGEELGLFTIAGNFGGRLVASEFVDGVTVAAWGDWGFALQESSEVILLTADGGFKARENGKALASHADGWILVHDDSGLKTLSAGGGVRRVLEVAESELRLSTASFSTDGSKVAIAGARGVSVIDLGDGNEVIPLTQYPAGWVEWSSDSRFVIAPAVSGVSIYDFESGEIDQVLVGHPIVTAAAIPLSG